MVYTTFLKSEGLIHKSEFDEWDTLESGIEIEVILEDLEDANGIVKLSKRKADRIRNWEKVLDTYAEGDIVEGTITKVDDKFCYLDLNLKSEAMLSREEFTLTKELHLMNLEFRTEGAEVHEVGKQEKKTSRLVVCSSLMFHWKLVFF